MAQSPLVLAYDIGGTKVAAALVDSEGNIMYNLRETTALQAGFPGLLQQLTDMADRLPLRDYHVSQAAIASAGPLHPQKGLLLDPTNLLTNGRSWGVQDLKGGLTKKLGIPVYLDNDAAAGMLAERWLGHARNCDNALLLTLGTGLGVAVLANGKLVRAGRGLHPEGGHIVINYDDPDAMTPTGIPGTAEAYLSGVNFVRRCQLRLGVDWDGPVLVDQARRGHPGAKGEFAKYAYHMAVTLTTFALLYAPEVVIIAGGFSHAADLFLPDVAIHLRQLLKRYRDTIDLLPELKVSQFQEEMGVLGAAWLGWSKGEV